MLEIIKFSNTSDNLSFSVNLCTILCGILQIKFPGYVTPINWFIILGLFKSSSWSHKMLLFIQQPIGFENNTKQRSKNPKSSFPAFFIFKIFSSLWHVKLILNFYVLEKWGSEPLSVSDIGHIANFSPFPPANKHYQAKSLGLIDKVQLVDECWARRMPFGRQKSKNPRGSQESEWGKWGDLGFQCDLGRSQLWGCFSTSKTSCVGQLISEVSFISIILKFWNLIQGQFLKIPFFPFLF